MFAKLEKKFALDSGLVERSEYEREARSASYSIRRAAVAESGVVLVWHEVVAHSDQRGRNMHPQ